MRALVLLLGLAACDRDAAVGDVTPVAPVRPPVHLTPRPALPDDVPAVADDDDPPPPEAVVAAEPAQVAGDRDSDDVVDVVDRCPDAPDDNEGFDDIDGCPEPEVDADTAQH